MFGNRREIRRINELKTRSEVERAQLVVGVSYFAPLVKKCVRIGIFALAAKQLAPAIRPITFGLIQRGLANRGRLKLFKLAGLVSTVIGLLRSQSAR
ncbi:hypothetical protein SH580_09080 [Coraliomargarita algicola]|uniref:Uncharacterized protein n=1 Tax=Coraliomargarita algicola TaxID=3092156 RepID=A0ABZ0RT30_9BACT|nr:hypothetical protein [Coraliomargarita sp. J2-16]WPJ98241.1 hypothetical protein SH580_09080 [Coraliomargarita sp. J2-16]